MSSAEARGQEEPLGADARGAAVARLWEELSGSLLSWFARRTGDPHAAADLLQESFLRVHDRLEHVREAGSLAAWLRSIARNLLVDWRRTGARVAEPLEAAAAALEDPLSAEDEQGLDAVVAGWLAPTIDELAPSDREVLRLTELEGLPQRAVADRLGLSLSAVKSRVLRGRERLRRRILDCCALEFDRRGGIVAYRKRTRAPCERCDDDGC